MLQTDSPTLMDLKFYRTYGFYLKEYPFILGQDVAGVVDAVGPGVMRFREGQRVIA